MIVLLALIRPTKISINTADFIKSEFPSSLEYERFIEDFPNQEELIILIEKQDKTPWNAESLCQLRQDLRERYKELQHLSLTYSVFNMRHLFNENDLLYYPLSLTPNCKWVSGQKNIFLSEDETQILILMQFKFDEHPLYGKFNPEQLQSELSTLNQLRTAYHVQYSGNLLFQLKMKESTDRSLLINLIFLAILIVCFRVFFGSYKSSLVYIATLVFVAIPLLATISLLGIPQTPLLTCLFVVISLACLEDFIIITSISIQGRKTSSFIKNIHSLRAPSFFTSLTTIVGFGVLTFSDIFSLRSFGLLVAFGALLEWLCLFFLLPYLMGLFPFLESWASPNKRFTALYRLSHWSPSKLVFPLSIVVFCYGHTSHSSSE